MNPCPHRWKAICEKQIVGSTIYLVWVLKSWGLGQPPQAQKLGLHMWSFSNLGLPAVTLRLAPRTRSHRSAAKFWEAPRHRNPGSSPFRLPGSFAKFWMSIECPMFWNERLESYKKQKTCSNTLQYRPHQESRYISQLYCTSHWAVPEWNKYQQQ